MKTPILIFIACLLVAACEQKPSPPAKLTADTAKFEAQKIAVALKGRAGSAAFIDVVLKDDAKYREIFTDGLKRVIETAPVEDPLFLPYKACVDSGVSLLRFAELRRLGGRQNEESDRHRRPYWDSLSACEKAISQQP